MRTQATLLSCLFCLAIIIFTSCGNMQTIALNSVNLTSQLQPGMTYAEVEGIMGKPKATSFQDNQFIARWNLKEMWKGYVPYDFIFTTDEKKLVSWSENTAAFEAQQQNLKLLVDEVEKAEQSTQAGGEAAPVFENDQELMRSFAGYYYSFSAVGGGQTGGTERKVMLCPDGTYRMNSESGYSGNAGTASAWGTAGQGGGSGTWRITGNMNNGTLVTTDNGGKSTTYKFERCGSDCVYFGNNKFALAGPPDCR